jgi:hypothetical protein
MTQDTLRYLKTDPKARFQGSAYFFEEGFCWTNILNPQARLLKAKMKSKTVNDVGSMSLYSIHNLVPDWYIVVLLNSDFLFDYYREFINCTVNIQINDIRQLPIYIPTSEQLKECKLFYDQVVALKKESAMKIMPNRETEIKLQEFEQNLSKFTEKLYHII